MDDLETLEAALSRLDDESKAQHLAADVLDSFLAAPTAAAPLAMRVAQRRRDLLAQRMDALTDERSMIILQRAAVKARQRRRLPPRPPTPPDLTARYN